VIKIASGIAVGLEMTMYRGSVDFIAEIKGNGLTFPHFDFNPHEPGVDKVEIEGLDGDVIRSTVHLGTVQSREAGISHATEVNTAALNRIAFSENIAIENARVKGDDFVSLDVQPGAHVLVAGAGGYLLTGGDVKFTVGRSPERLKAELEQTAAPGERYYGLFRSARQCMGPIEEFMHLYHLLLMIYDDKQAEVDAFILSADASVPQTQHPLKAPGVMETIYIRLRNEFAHNRGGVDLGQTKAEMMNRLGNLRMLTRQAIELRP
jgi:hypothetical protein